MKPLTCDICGYPPSAHVVGRPHPGPRRFVLVRDEDVTGVSGTGVVATGVLFPPTQAAVADAAVESDVRGEAVEPERHVAMEWCTEWPTSVVFHQRGLEALEHIHGHGGATRIVWLDEEPGEMGR